MAAAPKDAISAALSIMRRMPPNKIEHNLSGLINLIPQHTDELLQRVDQPLEEATDAETGRKYLLCDYNRDGDSYRSPWSNKYDPPIEDGFVPSAQLREVELEANQLFDAYRELYFEGGTSSVYLWDLEGGFAGCFLVKKGVSGHKYVSTGGWDSIHVVELTTTVMLSMDVHKAEVGDSNLSGSLTRTAEKTCVVDESHRHVANIGSMIEDMETDVRTYLDSLYIQKTREVVSSMRKLHAGGATPAQGQPFTMNLNAAVLKHGANRKVDSES
ncbi:F-actin-capping protein subunit beta [Pelagophyceae sp. CCMP2097]|nr:F-actin-capping protein subunit beta [Pelagophyceae sp. CCMP2097]